MAATVEVSETNGTTGSPSVTDGISNCNFGSADAPNLVPASHPIIIQGFLVCYSYTKWWRLHLVNLGGSTQLANLKMWKLSGAYVAGEVIGASSDAASAVAYGTSPITHGAVVPMPYNGTGVTVFVAGGVNKWENQPILNAEPVASNVFGTLNAPGQYSGFVNTAETGAAAMAPGAVNQKVFVWQYDET